MNKAVSYTHLECLEKEHAELQRKYEASLQEYSRQVEEISSCTAVDIAYTPADLCRLKKAGKKAVMLGIENGYAIGKDITDVYKRQSLYRVLEAGEKHNTGDENSLIFGMGK